METTTNENLQTVQKLINLLMEFFVNYSFQVLGAIIVLIAGSIIANWIAGMFLKLMTKKKMDVTLSNFLASCVRGTVLAFAVIIALGKFGITIAPFIAALSAMAFGASFAIQGPLSNYGAGISIILGRPFVVGNTIRIGDVSGVVKEVKLAATILEDEDGIMITIPNKDIVGKIIHNSRENKIVESTVGVSYEGDPGKAIQIISGVLQKFPEVVKQPGPQVGIGSFGDSAVNIDYRYWVPTAKYYSTLYAVNRAVFEALGQAGVNIPYPQREVRILSQTGAAVKS
jgi:small conductance mechanosensitive channel